MVVLDTVFAKGLYRNGDVWSDFKISTFGELITGLNLNVFGLMAVTVGSVEGEMLMAPGRMSEKDPKLEMVGLEATGFAMIVLFASLTSIFLLMNLISVS